MSCEDFITLCLMPFLSFSSSWKAHLYMPPTPHPSNPAHPMGTTSQVEYWKLMWVSKTCNFEIKWFIATLGIWCYSNMCCCSTPFGFFSFFSERNTSLRTVGTNLMVWLYAALFGLRYPSMPTDFLTPCPSLFFSLPLSLFLSFTLS